MAISEILDKQFFIRHYQRGYRWTKEQVEQLLEDIDSFTPRELKSDLSKKTFYCLQPVVLKSLSEETKLEIIKESPAERRFEGDWFEVVDGQQRLTTIYLVLQYINEFWTGRQKKSVYTIDYETRENCVDFLKKIRVEDDDITVQINTDNIDFYHISKAYQTIRNWELNYQKKFGKPFDEAEFQSKFLSYSKIIWYEVEDSEDSIELFERLNLGKIPLTNAELTKALFLSTDSFNELPKEEQQIKHFEIASMWDEIEHKLNEADKRFWSFITNKNRNTFETKIDLILDLIAEKPDGHPDHLFTFLYFLRVSEKSKDGVSGLSIAWNEIEHFYHTLLEWNSDRRYYHHIGYLIASKATKGYTKTPLMEFVKYSIDHDKKQFWDYIVSQIKVSVNYELSELRYDQHYDQIFNVLLLFNVETCRTTLSIDDFYPFKQHKSNQWSLEHIHAQNSDGLDQTKKEPWIQWLNLHIPVLDSLKEKPQFADEKAAIDNLISDVKATPDEKLNWALFSEFFTQITQFLSSDSGISEIETHGLANMALLSQPDNSALNSSAFIVKKKMILDLDKDGSFVPVCTRRAFQGYYGADINADEMFFWGPKEKRAYMQSILNILNPYLAVTEGGVSNDN